MSRATEAIKRSLQLKQVCTKVCKQGWARAQEQSCWGCVWGWGGQPSAAELHSTSTPCSKDTALLQLSTHSIWQIAEVPAKGYSRLSYSTSLVCVSTSATALFIRIELLLSFGKASVQCRFQNSPETTCISATHDKHICHAAAQIGNRTDLCPHYASPLLCRGCNDRDRACTGRSQLE